jgi:hypothetical protein
MYTYPAKKWNFLLGLTIISVLSENLTFVNMAGASLKLYHICALLGVLFAVFDRYIDLSRNEMILGAFFILFPLLPLYRINDRLEFFKSYLIYILFIIFVLLCFKKLSTAFSEKYDFYYNLLFAVIEFASIFGILQFLLNNVLNVTVLNNVFGSLEFQKLDPGMMLGLRRANSLFHEPSYFGWVECFGLAMLFYDEYGVLKRRGLKYAITIAGIVVSLSTSAYYCAIFLLILFFVIRRKDLKTFFGAIALVIVFIIVWQRTGVSSVFDRMSSINTQNSSAYERFNTPAEYVKRTFDYYLFLGRGMGQEGNVDKVGTYGLYKAVNNSVFGIWVTFGLGAIFYIGLYLGLFIKYIKENYYSFLFLCMTFFIYLSTGAALSFDTAIIVLMCILVMDAEIDRTEALMS